MIFTLALARLRYNIFVEAAAEVFVVLRETCEVAFQASPAYEILLLKAQMDEAEMEALEKVSRALKRVEVWGATG